MTYTSDEIRAAQIYPVTVRGQELHVKGPIAGCVTRFGIRHVDEQHARDWLAGVLANEKRGALNTEKINARLVHTLTDETIATLL